MPRQPLRLDRRDAAAEQPRGLDQLGRDDPAARLLAQVGARVAPEPDAARAEVPLVVVALQADVAEQPGEQRRGGAARRWPAMAFRRQPCSATTVCSCEWMSRHSRTRRGRDEVLAQPLLLLAVATSLCVGRSPSCAVRAAALLEPLPQLQVADELATSRRRTCLCFSSAACCCSSGRSRTSCTLSAAAMTSTSASDCALARLEDHAADARVERQLRELVADRRELVVRRRPRRARPAAA